MSGDQGENGRSDWLAVIAAVKTYLAFFVLVVLVVEAVLGGLALKAEGQNQLIAMVGMLTVFLVLIAVVSFFAYRKPEVLLRSLDDADAARAFCAAIVGNWWENISPGEPSALSFVDIQPDPATSTVRMRGIAYGPDGHRDATWETVATCVDPAKRKVFYYWLFYYWQGLHPSRPNEPFEGFGELSFTSSGSSVDHGDGFFSDTNVTDLASTTKKAVVLRRSTQADVRIMRSGGEKEVFALVRSRLAATE